MSYPTKRFDCVDRAGSLRQGDEIYTGSGKVKRVLAAHCPRYHSFIRVLVEGENEARLLGTGEALMIRRLFVLRLGRGGWIPA